MSADAAVRRLVYLTGTRADFGLMRGTLQLIAATPGLQLEVAVTGMHLSAAHGHTVQEVRTSGLPVSCAWFHAWNSSSSSARSAWSTTRPPTRSTKLRARSDRPERRGPVSSVALTGHRLHFRKCSKASRFESLTISRDSPWLWGQSSGSAI